jgi:hypothetical protein
VSDTVYLRRFAELLLRRMCVFFSADISPTACVPLCESNVWYSCAMPGANEDSGVRCKRIVQCQRKKKEECGRTRLLSLSSEGSFAVTFVLRGLSPPPSHPCGLLLFFLFPSLPLCFHRSIMRLFGPFSLRCSCLFSGLVFPWQLF